MVLNKSLTQQIVGREKELRMKVVQREVNICTPGDELQPMSLSVPSSWSNNKLH